MTLPVQITRDEALNLLRKWFDEQRLIHCLIKFKDGSAKVLGRIDNIADCSISISARKSKIELGEAYSAEIPLAASSEYEYIEGRHAPEPVRKKMQAYDAMLTVFASEGISFVLAVMPPLEESAQQ